MSIPQIIIPSKDNMFNKSLHIYKKRRNPIKNDTSNWFSAIYDMWDIERINFDILTRLKKLNDSNTISGIMTNITQIKQGIYVFKNKILECYNDEIANNMSKNLEMLLYVSQLSQIQKCYYEAEKVINSNTKKKDFEKMIRMFRKTFSDYDSNVIDLTCKNLEILFSFKVNNVTNVNVTTQE